MHCCPLLSAACFRQVGELLVVTLCVCRHTGTRLDSSDHSEPPLPASMAMQERDKLLSGPCFWQLGELLFVTLSSEWGLGSWERG